MARVLQGPAAAPTLLNSLAAVPGPRGRGSTTSAARGSADGMESSFPSGSGSVGADLVGGLSLEPNET